MAGSDVRAASAGVREPAAACYDGERVVAEESLGEGWAAVTTHRVLAYDPGTDGRRFVAVDRPNAADVTLDADGDPRLLGWGARAGVYGLAALGGGLGLRALDLRATLSVDVGGAPVGGVLAVVDVLAGALAVLATVLLGAGGLGLLAAIVSLWRYRRTRRPALTVERYGDDPVRLPTSRSAGERAAATLSAALAADQ